MMKDLDFEYPHKMERIRIKQDMMKLIDEEEKYFADKA